MFLGVVAICARVSNDKRSEPAADEQPWKIQPGRVGRSLVHSTQIANSIKNYEDDESSRLLNLHVFFTMLNLGLVMMQMN